MKKKKCCPCKRCDGAGFVRIVPGWDAPKETCDKCKGSGKVKR